MDQSIGRKLWRAAILPLQEVDFRDKALSGEETVRGLLDSGKIMGLSLFQWERHLFLYYETIDCDVPPEPLLPGMDSCLEVWPGEARPRLWIELIDVFHFNHPAGEAHWKRKNVVEKHIGKIGRLKPECVPHYIFYHYALQEERAFGGDKYEVIGMNENLLFAYYERPEVVEEPVGERKIRTNVVPKNWNDAGISACFIPWEDAPDTRLRPMNEVISVW